MSELIKVWYQLYGKDGNPLPDESPTQICVTKDDSVDDFKKAVLKENTDVKSKPSKLKVYQRQVDQGSSSASAPLEIVDLSNLELLKGSTKVNGLGVNEDFALIVVVPVYGIFF